jgi:ABC-2 type transport system ATP-binding protein
MSEVDYGGDTAVLTEGLAKSFKSVEALRGVDITVPRGSVLGLLGPNGAGKTTIVRILTTLLRADAGRAVVDGIDVATDPGRVRARIGLTGQSAAVAERLTGRENLELVGRHFHLPRATVKQRARELLEEFDLVEAGDRIAIEYSGGMRRRLDIAMSLIANPSVLFLDEPTTGLDPRSRLAMWDVIEDLGDEGTTTLLTTQYLEEADRLADSIVVIDHGLVIAEGTADELKDKIGGDRLRVTIAHADNLGRAVETLTPLCTGPVERDGGPTTLIAPIQTGGGVVPNAIRVLDGAGVEVIDIEVRRPTLDDVFLALTGHRAEADARGEAGPEEAPR